MDQGIGHKFANGNFRHKGSHSPKPVFDHLTRQLLHHGANQVLKTQGVTLFFSLIQSSFQLGPARIDNDPSGFALHVWKVS